MSELLEDRRRALEDAFFAAQDAKLRQKLAEADTRAARKAALIAASGIQDGPVLERLLDLDMGPEALTALSLVPLILVAWADGEIDGSEKTAILKAAAESHLPHGSAGHALLEGWLKQRPPARLFETWSAYVHAATASLDAAQRTGLRDHLLGQARSVAEAAGRFLGFGSAISSSEAAVLEKLEAAFG